MLFGSGSQTSSIKGIWRLAVTLIASLLGGLGWSLGNCFSKNFWLTMMLLVWDPHFENGFRTKSTSRNYQH